MDAPPTKKAMLWYDTTQKYSYFIILSDYLTQIYLVAGGINGQYYKTSSTEIYEAGQWTEVGALPAAVNAVRGANVYMLGKKGSLICYLY